MGVRVPWVILIGIPLTGVFFGCTDTEQAVGPETLESRPVMSSFPAGMTLTAEKRTIAKFDLEVEALGNLVPRQPIQVRAMATNRFSASDPQIYIVFPEIEAARMSGWDSNYRLPSRQRLARRGVRPLARSPQSQTETTASIVAERPGYYRAVVTAKDVGAQPNLDARGRYVLSTTHREVWLWINEDGGRVTEVFDESLFPAQAIIQPGPLRFRSARVEQASLLGSVLGTARAKLRDWGVMTTSIANYELKYWNYDESQYDPVSGAYYQVDHLEYDGRDRIPTIVGTSTGYSTESGTILFDCLGEEHDGHATPDNNSTIWIYGGSGASIIGDDSDCDSPQPIQIVMNSAQAHVFTSMQSIVSASRSTFGYSRGDLEVRLNPSDGSYYSPDDDRVVIRSGTGSDDHVWDSWGQFVMAHEYGHALHEKGLN